MGQPMLPLALQQRPDYASPYAAEMEAVRQRMAQPYPEAYSPEEQRQRAAENQRMMQLGILGQLSGDEQAGNVGGMVLKNALAARAPHMTERGVGDPLTGRFSYNSAYRQERDQQRLDTLGAADAAARGRHDEAAQRRDENAALAMTLKAMGHGGGGNGGSGPGVKATLEGFDPATGDRVVVDKTGTPLRIGADGRQVPHQGPIVPKLDWEKGVNAAAESLGALQSANSLLAQAEKNPGAFGLTAKMYGAVPNWAKGWSGSMMGLSDAEQQTITKVQQAAALEIHKLYGAALSAGEDKRASTFLPNPDDDASVLMNKLYAMRDLVQSTVNRAGPAALAQAKARTSGLENVNPSNPPAQPNAAPPGRPGAPAAAPGGGGGLTPEEQAELAQRRARRGQTGSTGGTY